MLDYFTHKNNESDKNCAYENWEGIKKEESEPEETSIEELLEKTKLCELNGISMHKIDSRKIFNSIENWEFNRKINQKHVKNLYQFVCRLFGTYKIARLLYDENKLLLIDGQHRVEAIRMKMREDNKFNMDVLIEIKNVENEEEIVDFFYAINNIVKVDKTNIPLISYIQLVKCISTEFPEIFERKKPRPFVEKRYLQNLFKSKKIFENYRTDVDDFYERIKEKNRKVGEKASPYCGKYSNRAYNNAQKIGFYLTLDDKDEWLDEILSEVPKIIHFKKKK